MNEYNETQWRNAYEADKRIKITRTMIFIRLSTQFAVLHSVVFVLY